MKQGVALQDGQIFSRGRKCYTFVFREMNKVSDGEMNDIPYYRRSTPRGW